MSEGHHPPDYLGEECPSCGTVHRVLSSLPDQPLTMEQIEALRESETVVFARGVEMMSGGLFGYDTDKEVTENIVLTTDDSSQLLSRYEGTGWVVEQQVEHEPDEDPQEVGQEVWMEASQHLSDALHEVFDQ